MIKIFRGAGVVTPSKPPPPYQQLLPLPTHCFKMFFERSLNDPPPPHFKHLSLLPPSPSTTPSPIPPPPVKILIIHQSDWPFKFFQTRGDCDQFRIANGTRVLCCVIIKVIGTTTCTHVRKSNEELHLKTCLILYSFETVLTRMLLTPFCLAVRLAGSLET